MSTLETVGQLRSLLAATIVDVREARIETSRAAIIAKLAAEINHSLLTEVAAARMKMHQNLAIPSVGGLVVGDEQRPLHALRAPAKMVRATADADAA